MLVVGLPEFERRLPKVLTDATIGELQLWVPLALDHFGVFSTRLPEGLVVLGRQLGTLGPAIAASVIARIADGRGGMRALWGQLGRWRVKWTWYAAALLVFPALLAAETSIAAGEDVDFMKAKVATARFYADHILSRAPGLREAIVDGAAGVTEMALEAY